MNPEELLSKVSLSKLTKDEIIEYTLNLQTSIFNKMKNLEDRFTKLESELQVTKSVNSKLVDQITYLQRKCAENEQYSRRECIELVGIPKSVKDEDLEKTVCDLLDITNASVKPESLQACHRLKKKDRVIVKFKDRKQCLHVLMNKKLFKEADLSNFNFPDKTKIFVNESLCGYYRGLWGKCNKKHIKCNLKLPIAFVSVENAY